MDKFSTHTGIAVPLRRSNVDTDQIIPAVYLKRVTRTGFEDGLFAAWRNDPAFVLNQPAYTPGSILVAGPDFGTGSSREHAVWALQNYGFKVVIGTRFGDIFRNNAGKAGLVVATVGPDVVETLWEIAESEPGITFTVDPVSYTHLPVTKASVEAYVTARRPSSEPSTPTRIRPRSMPARGPLSFMIRRFSVPGASSRGVCDHVIQRRRVGADEHRCCRCSTGLVRDSCREFDAHHGSGEMRGSSPPCRFPNR